MNIQEITNEQKAIEKQGENHIVENNEMVIPANSAKTCKDEQKNLEYNYEQYNITSDWCNGEVIEHIKDYINDAQEIKITRISNGWSLEIKTRIK